MKIALACAFAAGLGALPLRAGEIADAIGQARITGGIVVVVDGSDASYDDAADSNCTVHALGWFGVGPKSGRYEGLQFDEIEYLMCKSLAYNAPISLQTSFSRMEAHPLTPDVLEIVRQYEQIRLAGQVPEATRSRLKQPGRDFVMLPAALTREGRAAEFVEVEAVGKVAGTHDVRGFVGPYGEGTMASVWHYLGKEGKLVLDAPGVTAYDIKGGPVRKEKAGQKTAIPVGNRRVLLHFPGRPAEAVRRLLTEAALELRKPVVLWIQAEQYRRRVGTMVAGAAAGVAEPDALGEVVLCGGRLYIRHDKNLYAYDIRAK